LETGDIDAASFSGKEIVAVDEFRGDPDFKIKEGKSWWVLNLYFNVYEYPMNNADFRRAIAYGINRTKIVHTETRDGSILANTGLMHPESKWCKHGLPGYEHNIAKAKEILKDLGFEDTDLKFTLFTTEDYAREAESIKLLE
jgi:peptide/nickel transport system substrate-binding protein